MSKKYEGVLARKLNITILGSRDPEVWAEYQSAVIERHNALFSAFDIVPPTPDDATHPAWRDLALALARQHVPAFRPVVGRPESSRESAITWFLASKYFQIRDDVSMAEADRMVAIKFNVDLNELQSRLKDLRKESEYSRSGAFNALFSNIESERGRATLVEWLSGVLNPDPDFNRTVSEYAAGLGCWPYGKVGGGK